ncbi:hypothetical protein [Rhodopirellula sp. P2]|uniref:hypothetical protein n=1 Tax=Rhodopirellula sp. P2 TaxID=2127060 RepID=UPI002367D8E3|nr:hypothetical protein [Rhodopirellula sp. P2]WDQ19136.1 hypothetical protein PSR62_11485 [Rhodopirellula sp. P2]
MISLSRPALQQSDLDAIEIDSLKKIAAASEDIEALEARRTTQQEQIATLEQQKGEMEILVQRASLSLFLQEQHRHHSDRIAKAIKKSPSITQSLDELARIKEKIDALETEIETDPNVELLRSVINSAKSPTRDDDWVDDVPHPFRAYVRLLRRVAETLAESMKLVIRP